MILFVLNSFTCFERVYFSSHFFLFSVSGLLLCLFLPYLFSANTLETAKYYDDQGKLVVVDGDGDESTVQYEFGKAFDDMFYSQHGTQPLGTAAVSMVTENIGET